MLISNILIGKILNHIRLLNHYDEDDIDMMRYSLQVILWEVEKAIILLLLFTFMRQFYNFLITCIATLSIRILAGGYHSKTAISCLLITFIGFFLAIMIFPQIPLNDIGIVVLSIFSLLTTLLAAPLRSIEKEAIQKKDKDIHKKMIAFVITLIWLIFVFIYQIKAYPVLWIIVLQNVQLLLEYLGRKRKKL